VTTISAAAPYFYFDGLLDKSFPPSMIRMISIAKFATST
jgi:hypothetical protein